MTEKTPKTSTFNGLRAMSPRFSAKFGLCATSAMLR